MCIGVGLNQHDKIHTFPLQLKKHFIGFSRKLFILEFFFQTETTLALNNIINIRIINNMRPLFSLKEKF